MMEFSLSELNKLLGIQYKLDKSINNLLPLFNKFHVDMMHYSKELEEKRIFEKQSLQEKLKEIHSQLHCKLDLLVNNKLDGIFDFQQFKREMIHIQDNIQNLKTDSHQKIEQLTGYSNEIYEDIDYFNAKILEWSKPIQINAYNNLIEQRARAIVDKDHKPKCKEVKDFIHFLHVSGGHENGWRGEDHQLFIKFMKKYKDRGLVAHNLHEVLPDISIEEINLHQDWYEKYLKLEKAKQEAIEAWKRSSTNNKKAVVSEGVISKPNIFYQDQNKQYIQEQLNKWKLEKQMKLQNSKEIELKEENRKRHIEELRKQRQKEIKKIVNEWKCIKTAIEQRMTLEKNSIAETQKKMRAIEANRLIKQFQSQDDMYIAKVKQLKKRQELQVPMRSKSSQIVSRDPNRLLKPTKQWINRVHDDTVYSNGYTNVVPVTKLPKLGIPEWKKRVT